MWDNSIVTNFSLAQLALITAVTASAKGPVVAMVFSGGAMDVSPLLSNPKVQLMIWLYLAVLQSCSGSRLMIVFQLYTALV